MLGCCVQVGAVVWCFVRRIESYGVLLGIENTRISGLLHISAISRAHVENPWVSAVQLARLSCLLTKSQCACMIHHVPVPILCIPSGNCLCTA